MKKHLILIVGIIIFIAILVFDWFLWVGGWPTFSQAIIWAETKSPVIYTQIVFGMGFLAGHWFS